MESANDGFGPICRKRDGRKIQIILFKIILIAALLIVFAIYRIWMGVMFSYSDFYFIAGATLSILVAEFIRRCSLFEEEYFHVNQRYQGSKIAAFQECISLPNGKLVIGIILAGALGYTIQSWIQKDASVFSFGLYIITSLVISFCANILNIDRTTIVEISARDEAQPKNVSAGNAWTYYFGYLKLVLPVFPTIFGDARGDNFQLHDDDIRDLVTDTSLFIIIPKDGFCYKEFSQVDPRIQFVHTMPELKRTRGGVMERVYKTSLYQIEIPGKKRKYAVMEYATPLLAMYDMAEYSKVKFSEEDKLKEIVQFYVRLDEILKNDLECAGRYKLILTAPVATNDDGQKKLADIIWDSIE